MSITRRRSQTATDGASARPDGSGHARAWRRIGRGALVAAAGTAALSLAGPFALRPFVDAAQAAGTAGEVTVAFVIDFGGGSTPVKGCVKVPPSDNGYQALSAFLTQHGMAQPTFNSQGLLCSINAVPSSGCGVPDNGGYIYWSYWFGSTGSWAYANTGAGGTVVQGDVQGWRFQNPGTGRPNDPPPRVAANFNAICSSNTGGGSKTGSGGSPGPHGTHSGSRGSGAGSGGTGGTHHPKASTRAAGAAAPSAHGATKSTASTATTTTTYPSDSSNGSPADIQVPGDPEVSLANSRQASSTGSGPGPDPLIIGGLLIAALAVAAYARWRKRSRTP